MDLDQEAWALFGDELEDARKKLAAAHDLVRDVHEMIDRRAGA